MTMDSSLEKIRRPKITQGSTVRVETNCGKLYVTVNRFNDEMFEVFAWLGKSGGCTSAQLNTLTLSITMGIRYGIDPQVYIDKLKGTRCQSISWDDGIEYLSCADAIAQVMELENEKIKVGYYIEGDDRLRTEEEFRNKEKNKTQGIEEPTDEENNTD